MIDRLIDIFYIIKDKLEEVWWWVLDNIKATIVLGVLVLAFVIGFLGYRNANSTETDKIPAFSSEHLAYLRKNSSMVNKMFLNLDEDTTYNIFGASPQSLVASDNSATLIYNLYVRKPFTDSETIEETLETFLELVQLQTKSEGYSLRLLKVNLFFRKETYTEGLEPDGTFKYMLDSKKLDIEKLQTETKYATSSEEDITENETALATKIKPKDYTNYFSYQELTVDNTNKALTDEEFESYIKLDKYVALAGGFNAGVKLYLQWELGANVTNNPYINISNQFKEFKERLASTGERTEYFSTNDYLVVLENTLAVYNPQLLVFAMDNKVIKDPTEARKYLLESSTEYKTKLVSFTETQGEKYITYKKVYEPASIDFLNNLNNSQKIAKGYVNKKGLPLNNIDYDDYFEGKIDINGNEIKQDDSEESSTKSTDTKTTESSTKPTDTKTTESSK